MRSTIHSTFATLLLMVPVLAIPALAIFGIPQFAPVVVSPLDEGEDEDRERRVGQSARLGEFADELDDAPAFDSGDSRGIANATAGIGDSVPLNDASGGGLHSHDFRRPAPPNSRSDSFSDPLNPVRPARNRGGAERGSPALEDFGNPTAANAGPQWGDNRGSHAGGAPITTPFQAADGSNRGLNAVDTPASDTGINALTWPEALRRLNELEIRDFRLGRGLNDNEFLFVCSYSPNGSPLVSYRFEAESTEPLKAVENVLEQVVAWQQKRRR